MHIVSQVGGEVHHSHFFEGFMMALSVMIALVGITFSYMIYMKHGDELPEKLARLYAVHHKLVYNKYYVDEIYDFIVVKPIYYFSIFLWKVVDVVFVDGYGVNGPAKVVRQCSAGARLIHNGYVQTGGAFMLLGLVAIMFFYMGYR
jgi:NADH-quinone oxidoreductase subunit L